MHHLSRWHSSKLLWELSKVWILKSRTCLILSLRCIVRLVSVRLSLDLSRTYIVFSWPIFCCIPGRFRGFSCGWAVQCAIRSKCCHRCSVWTFKFSQFYWKAFYWIWAGWEIWVSFRKKGDCTEKYFFIYIYRIVSSSSHSHIIEWRKKNWTQKLQQFNFLFFIALFSHTKIFRLILFFSFWDLAHEIFHFWFRDQKECVLQISWKKWNEEDLGKLIDETNILVAEEKNMFTSLFLVSTERVLIMFSCFRFPLVGNCTKPTAKGPFTIKSGSGIFINFKNVLNEIKEFHMYVDNPAFSLLTKQEEIRPKNVIKTIKTRFLFTFYLISFIYF